MSLSSDEELYAEYLQKVGDKILEYRVKMNMSQGALALECGMDKPNLRKLEKGKGNPTVKTLLRLAMALEIEPKELLDIK